MEFEEDALLPRHGPAVGEEEEHRVEGDGDGEPGRREQCRVGQQVPQVEGVAAEGVGSPRDHLAGAPETALAGDAECHGRGEQRRPDREGDRLVPGEDEAPEEHPLPRHTAGGPALRLQPGDGLRGGVGGSRVHGRHRDAGPPSNRRFVVRPPRAA